jgi:hypothetical protein
LPIKVLLIQG